MGRYEFSLKNLKNTAILGLRRAMTFSAMALTGKYDAGEITNFAQESDNLVFRMPQLHEVKESNLDSSVKSFQDWTILNSVCEVYEFFHTFIDEMLVAVSLLKMQEARSLNEQDIVDMYERVRSEQLSLSDKMTELSEKYEISLSKERKQYFAFLERIRHCVTHNHGVVLKKYFPNSVKGKPGYARIEWLEGKMQVVDKKGQKRTVKKERVVNKGDLLVMKFSKGIKEVPYDHVLKLEFDDIHKIAFTVFGIVEEVVKSASPLFKTDDT
jgi:hypothetical protein